MSEMKVTKRNGAFEIISFDKILKRLKALCKSAKIEINCTQLAIKVIDRLYDNIETTKIDEFAAEHCATMICNNYDYGILASYIIITNHQKNTSPSFSETMSILYEKNILNDDFFEIVKENAVFLDGIVNHERDFLIDYFGFKTLERAYLLKDDGKTMERIQYMWLRTAICIHKNNMDKVAETYELMSQKFFTHATPTLFNAGTRSQQLSSCFLVAMKEDSVDGIFDTLKECAKISKYAGGIGVHIHNIRAKGSVIDKKNRSNGICPMLRVFNSTARYIDQGGKRNGSIAVYLEPWHYDIEDFLEMRKNHGDEEMKARDLFYGLWIPDLFMERIKENKDWCLFCPNNFPGLADVYGEKFNELYLSYEANCVNGLHKKIKARDLWFKILDSQMETGTPYLLYKDAANRKSNQQNLGTIKSSNLCTEIIEYTDENETAVCNLASIGLPNFVENKVFNYEKLHTVTKIVTNNLNNIIDETFYPCDTAKTSNFRHRPIGIGVQGLADVFFLMDVAYHSEEAKVINKQIFETMYHAALEKSTELAKEFGCYSSFLGSPASKGILQFDMWNVTPDRYNWDKLKGDIHYQGLRNSLLLAPMPTASTSQILGYNECFEPNSGNIYSRRTLAGEFIVANKYLMKELNEIGMWNETIKQSIIENKGSVQHLDISPHLKEKYKIVWEIPMKHLIDMSVDRGAFICQSQSLNLWVEAPNYNILTSMHFYAWSKGLKTGCYYLRRKPTHTAQQFTIEPKAEPVCDMCSS